MLITSRLIFHELLEIRTKLEKRVEVIKKELLSN